MTEQELEQRVMESHGYLEARLPDRRHCDISFGARLNFWRVAIFTLDKPEPDIAWTAHSLAELAQVGSEQYHIDITMVTARADEIRY